MYKKKCRPADLLENNYLLNAERMKRVAKVRPWIFEKAWNHLDDCHTRTDLGFQGAYTLNVLEVLLAFLQIVNNVTNNYAKGNNFRGNKIVKDITTQGHYTQNQF